MGNLSNAEIVIVTLYLDTIKALETKGDDLAVDWKRRLSGFLGVPIWNRETP
jgi:hypothetical protein